MDSVYKNMQSSPYQKDQMHFGPCYYPGAEALPAQMYVNTPRPPVNYGYWPWGNNYGCGYASPAVCHGCCNHAYWPANHSWGSPCSHVPPSHCPGSYSIPLVPYIPPLFYAMEQPRSDYEKNVPRDHHYCGCPNHPSHQKEHKNVRIEEEEPDGERGKNDSVVPFNFKNKPYPVVWLPPDFGKNKEYGKPNNLEDSKDGFREVKPNDSRKTVEQQPSSWYRWYPLDLSSFPASKQMGDGEKNHHKQDEGKGQLPFPLFWIPYKPEGKESEECKVNDANMKSRLESGKGSSDEQNFYENGENVGQSAHRAKDIPVKEVEQHEEKENPKNKAKENDALVKDGRGSGEKNLDNGEKKLPKDGAKRKCPSPPKSPKLPPVCLRVDPLPRKKSANGSSRSPSPAGDKQKVDQPSKEGSNVSSDHNKPNESLSTPGGEQNVHQPSKESSKVSSDNNKMNEITNSEVKAGKGVTKIIDVVDGNARQADVNVETPTNHPVNSQEHVSRNHTEGKPKEESASQKHIETDEAVVKGRSEDVETAREKNEEKEVRVDEAKESSKRKLSEEEAAVIIQSAYRGFDIRKWEYLKKLKQIANIREQTAEVKQLVHAMQSSSDIQGNSKQKNILAETIMSLLLNLDTIQGLHPSIREVRKSVVRELVDLQEKLDSLMNKRSQALSGEESIIRRDKDAVKETEDVKPSQNDDGTVSDLLETHDQNHLEGGFNCESLQTREGNPIEDQPIQKLEEVAAEPTIGNVDEKSSEALENVDPSIAKKDHLDLELGQSPEVPLLPNYLEEAVDFASTDQGELGAELAELPIGVLDDLCAQEGTNERAVEADASVAGPTEQLEGELIGAPITSESLVDMTDKENKEQVELHELMDLPFGGDNVISEASEPLNDGLIDDKFGVEEKVDNKIGDALFEPDECAAQQPENVIPGILEASGGRAVPIAEAENSLEEKMETIPEVQMCGPLAQEDALEQESSLINESVNSYGAADMIEVKEAAEDKSSEDGIDSGDQQRKNVAAEPQMTEEGIEVEEVTEGKCAEDRSDSGDQQKESQMTKGGTLRTLPEMGALIERTEESNLELPKENLEAQTFDGNEENAAQDGMEVTSDCAKDGLHSQVGPTLSGAEGELNESNRKLIEENERLRDMMQKLIQSGQEQLNAISSLSGRVKDLEKRLSRKKKLKMKHYRAARFGSSCMTSPDGSPKRRTAWVAM